MNISDSVAFIFGLLLSLGGIILVVFIILGILIIYLAVYLYQKDQKEERACELYVNQIMQSIPVDKQMIFLMQYNGKKKNPLLALLLAYFLGGFGAHKFYIGQNDLGIIYLLFCWTGFPSLLALVECFWIASVISKINRQKALEIANLIGGGSSYLFM